MSTLPAILTRRDKIPVVCVTREYVRGDWFIHHRDHYGEPKSSQVSSARIAHLECGHEFEIPAEGAAPAAMECRWCQ